MHLVGEYIQHEPFRKIKEKKTLPKSFCEAKNQVLDTKTSNRHQYKKNAVEYPSEHKYGDS